MNSINGTIDLLLSLVAREQRNADAAQPHDPAEEYRQQLQALLHSRQDDPALHRELLRLSGLHDVLEARHAAFHFRSWGWLWAVWLFCLMRHWINKV